MLFFCIVLFSYKNVKWVKCKILLQFPVKKSCKRNIVLDTLWSFISEFFELISVILLFLLVCLFIYDRYVQRKHQLLINYPVIGRMRYLFEALREPLRQYFAEETFYESRDKIDWVYNAAKNRPNFKSFSVDQPFRKDRFILKHSSSVLNDEEVSDDFCVTFGEKREKPFTSQTPIIRSAMSDGALSPEAVRAFSLGATLSKYTVNIGEGGFTSNHLYTLKPDRSQRGYLEIVKSNLFADIIYKLMGHTFNHAMAVRVHRKLLLKKSKTANTYIYEPESHILFRVNWDAPLDAFPEDVPDSLPDMVFQMSSGLYGVRDEKGHFDEERYAKVMRFCRMTEIKIAQGAKQTGGKLSGSKVTADIAYYRGVKEGEDIFSPNRFPYATSIKSLLRFIEKLQKISQKPVGLKIVISDAEEIDRIIRIVAKRKKRGCTLPDFITVDSGEGGSATAPLELMEAVGLNTKNSLYILDDSLRRHGLREDIKIIASGKILTPDDIAIVLSLGADAVGIARGFMMSGGCIRARMCSGFGSHKCPIGMATQDPKIRASYLVVKQAHEIANYHTNLLNGLKTILAVMGYKNIKRFNKKNLTYRNRTGDVYFNIDDYFSKKLHR